MRAHPKRGGVLLGQQRCRAARKWTGTHSRSANAGGRRSLLHLSVRRRGTQLWHRCVGRGLLLGLQWSGDARRYDVRDMSMGRHANLLQHEADCSKHRACFRIAWYLAELVHHMRRIRRRCLVLGRQLRRAAWRRNQSEPLGTRSRLGKPVVRSGGRRCGAQLRHNHQRYYVLLGQQSFGSAGYWRHGPQPDPGPGCEPIATNEPPIDHDAISRSLPRSAPL